MRTAKERKLEKIKRDIEYEHKKIELWSTWIMTADNKIRVMTDEKERLEAT